jgi:hypothetical protein
LRAAPASRWWTDFRKAGMIHALFAVDIVPASSW